MDRRQFLKTAAAGTAMAAVSGTAGPLVTGCTGKVRTSGSGGKMVMSFEPYELQLRHVFTVSSYSRKTTPGVQVRIDYEGITGYGEASMPPYLGQSVETVMAFLS
ncbi:MAG: twin-arginine translocation signal domain-containing protein, partial [Bacteroidales bacterium]|nr:twin-arginine translocation signal domain-containing protein [Bacteroidales bacterium]